MPSLKQFSILSLFILALIYSCQQAPSNLTVPAIFADHIVLQQNSTATIWGKATPNTKIKINGSWGASAITDTNPDGKWETRIATPKAGGPFELDINAGDTTIVLHDVMIGEVWICSGQSNMEMPLKGWPPNDLIDNSANEIANANYPLIRMFTVTKAFEINPIEEYSGSWEVCNPSNADDFSATAYFFGRELHQKLNIPIGLIHTSWGGTLAEAWTEGKHLSSLSDFNDVLAKLETAKPQQAALDAWLNTKTAIDRSEYPIETRWQGLDLGDAAFLDNANTNDWLNNLAIPGLWENAKANLDAFDGAILFKKAIDLPANYIGKDLTIELGPIDDADETYFNGQKIGGLYGYNINRVYSIPKELVKKEGNILSVRVIDTGGGGGIHGDKNSMKIYPKGAESKGFNISGNDWYYLPLAEFKSGKLYKYGGTLAAFNERPKVDLSLSANTPTVLYNAMIAPLVPYTIKGAIWYQGESNAGKAKQYETLFPKMIESWRTVWNQGDFPFYYTQIAPFNYNGPNELMSAQLRDAQRKSLQVTNTGMAVTLDVGNPTNIHPGNKQDVGKRLALWALAKDYGQELDAYSGPLFKEMKVENGKIKLSFQFAETGLKAKGEQLSGFEIAGANGEFLSAIATIEGNEIIVGNNKIKTPTQVRYAFKNASDATLFNGAGLPASSFSTAD